jgi:hypothetical protein
LTVSDHRMYTGPVNRIVTFLTDSQLKKLKERQKKSGQPASTLIRMAVAEFLEKK